MSQLTGLHNSEVKLSGRRNEVVDGGQIAVVVCVCVCVCVVWWVAGRN